MTAGTPTITPIRRAASMVLIPFLSLRIRRRLFISSPYLVPVQTNWLLRVVTTVTVYETPDENWYVAPVQLEPHAELMAMFTETNPLGLTEAGYFPRASVGRFGHTNSFPVYSLGQ